MKVSSKQLSLAFFLKRILISFLNINPLSAACFVVSHILHFNQLIMAFVSAIDLSFRRGRK